jgi:Uma2 family endonuclease
MSSAISRSMLEIRYDESARAYLASLPPEHFMEATPQATQREITVESFALLRLRRPDVHYFNELLVQYPFGMPEETGKVVPDNMIVLHDGPIRAEGHYAVEIQPARPFLVLEYVSKGSERKDYEGSFRKYERELEVPYYLLFYPETQDLSLFYRGENRYVSVKPNQAGRLAIPELDLEVALRDGWARYWYRGELLPLPADLQRTVDEMAESLHQAREEIRRSKEETRRSKEETRRSKEETRRSKEETRQANDLARLAQVREADERLQKEKLLAQLRALGIEPNS